MYVCVTCMMMLIPSRVDFVFYSLYMYINTANLFLCCAASRKMSGVTGAATEGVTDSNCYWLNFNF